MWTASQTALQDLSELCPDTIDRNVKIDASWDGFLKEPLSADADRVAEIARGCQTIWSYNKRDNKFVQTVESFNMLHLTKPSCVPFRLLWAVTQERRNSYLAYDHLHMPLCPIEDKSADCRLQRHGALFTDLKMRRLLIQNGIQTLQALSETVAYDDCKIQLAIELLQLSDKEYVDKVRKLQGVADEPIACAKLVWAQFSTAQHTSTSVRTIVAFKERSTRRMQQIIGRRWGRIRVDSQRILSISSIHPLLLHCMWCKIKQLQLRIEILVIKLPVSWLQWTEQVYWGQKQSSAN